MKKKLIYLSVITITILALDQWSKNWILADYEYGESMDVIKNFFNITYVRNYGAAFGMLSEIDASIRNLFFLLMPPCAMAIILVMLKMSGPKEKWRSIALSAVFAGALGNYIDRLRFGYVVDFLDFHYFQSWSYPAFNVADMSIVCGVGVLIILEILTPQPDKKTKKVKA